MSRAFRALALALDLAFLPINLYLGLLELRDALR